MHIPYAGYMRTRMHTSVRMVLQEEVLQVVKQFNENPDVHGILVQLPLPNHIDEQTVLGAISVDKDVDGFHPLNIGRLAMKVCTCCVEPLMPSSINV